MLRNYFKIAWRNLLKHKTFSVINIAGLSIGIAVCFVIMMYVQKQLSFDRFNENADRIVRIVFKANINGGKIFEANVMPPVAQSMKNDYGEVQDATRLQFAGTPKIIYKDKIFQGDEMAFVDPNFFKIFTLPLLKGDANTALEQPNTVIITKAAAKKYFGTAEPIGKVLTFPGSRNISFKVTGVMDQVPANSHFHFDLFASMLSVDDARSDSWMVSNFFTYLLLKEGADYKKLESKLPGMVEKYMGPQIVQSMGISLKQFITKGNHLGFTLQPLTSIHLYSRANFELSPPGNVMYVYIFGAIAIFMLLIACINFINLTTASASKRAKEVGVRKVIGSGKGQLIKQFLMESALLVLIALLISVVLVQLALPVFNRISGEELHLVFDAKIVALYIGFGLLVSLAAGLYPAFYLSSFKPVEVLKGNFFHRNKTFGLRSGLVVFQFFISVALIVGTLVIWQQMRFIQNKNLGYDKEQLVTIPNSYVLGKNEEVYKQEMLQHPQIINATVSSYKPAGPSSGGNALAYPQGRDHEIMRTTEYRVDENYIPTFRMQIISGRNFSKDLPTDSTAMVLNETAAKAFGWDNSTAIGKTIVRENSSRGSNVPYQVIGIVKDFNFESLHQPVTPLLMTLVPDVGLIFRVKTADVNGLLAIMKTKWDAFDTGEPFSYSFIDDLYNKTYAAELNTGTILNIFSVLTILVACLGLFGLATYTAEQRTKEIGIRKVLGASVSSVTKMLSKDFIRLVCISCFIAFPLSWWMMNKWLQSFAYRIEMNAWMFLAAGLIAISIAMITVSLQAIKAAIANPVESLRSE